MFKIIAGVFLALLIIIAVILLPILFPFMGTALLLAAAFPQSRGWAAVKAYHLWIAFDKFANAMRFHDHRETISSCLGKAIYHGHPPVFNFLIIDKCIGWMLDKVDKNHCKNSIDWNVGRNRHWHMRPYNFL